MKGLKRLTGVIGAVIILTALGFNACSKDGGVTGPITLQGDESYSVSGYVYDTRSGLPVPGVLLKFYDPDLIGQTYTAGGNPYSPDYGHYYFYLGEERINHTIGVFASKWGYFDDWSWFLYYPGPSYTLNIYIQPKDAIIDEPPPQ